MVSIQQNNNSSQQSSSVKSQNVQENSEPRHGRVITPASRAVLYSPEWVANGLESGKFFPLRVGGVSDPIAPDDVKNIAPPADGEIASAGNPNAKDLDVARDDWYKHTVKSGQTIDVKWAFTANHVTRRYKYIMTKLGWDPKAKLTREQFEDTSFVTFENSCQPYWECEPPTEGPTHHFTLPPRTGYHVMLAIWEIANTSMAFYQVIDLNFS